MSDGDLVEGCDLRHIVRRRSRSMQRIFRIVIIIRPCLRSQIKFLDSVEIDPNIGVYTGGNSIVPGNANCPWSA